MGSLASTRPLALLLLAGCVIGIGCGASAPREADIFHDPALRPGVGAVDAAEFVLLAQLGDPTDTSIVVGAHTYSVEAAYDAASGRRCRGVISSGSRRLACENPDATWVFVPDIVGSRSDR